MRANRKTVYTFEVCANMVIALAAETYFTKSRVGHYSLPDQVEQLEMQDHIIL